MTARVVATAGHVDHGKSTLVRALTGMEPDRLAEERRRGLTIDLGFAWTRLPSGTDLAFVDVPGHERFVTTMLAGTGPVPAVLMVVAADEGWMPQSAEHLDALDALGVEHGLLVITRCDLLDPEPAREDAIAEIAHSSLGTVGVVEVCAPRGEGLASPAESPPHISTAQLPAGRTVEPPEYVQYEGRLAGTPSRNLDPPIHATDFRRGTLDGFRTALDGLVAAVPEPDPHADVRLWVDRAFSIRGAGTVVTGTLGAGTVRVGDELELGGRRVHVRGLQSLGEPVEVARGVARIAVNLRGIPREVVSRGDALLTPESWLTPAEVDVALRGVRGAEPGPLPREVMLHVGSAAVTVHARPLGPGFARLRPDRPLPLRIGDRAVLRDPGRRAVVAGVVVLDVLPPALRRRGAAARRADELAEPDVGTAAGELRRRGLVRAADLMAMGLSRAEIDGEPAARADGWLVAPSRAREAVSALAAAVQDHDAADPLDPGIPIEAARRAADLPAPGLVAAVLATVSGAGTPQLRDGRVHLARAHGLPERVRAALDAVRADLAANPFRAPAAARLAELGLGTREVAALVRAGELLAIADGVVLLPDAPDRAADVLRGVGPTFTLSEARQALCTTRRVAVPLLEHLARTGRTVRADELTHRLR